MDGYGLFGVIFSGVAAVVAVAAWVSARKQAADAKLAADRAAAAAERSAAVDEAMLARERAQDEMPPWEIARDRPILFRLINTSVDTLYDVTLDGPPIADGNEGTPTQFGPGEEHGFRAMFATTAHLGDKPVVVSWKREPGGPTRTWRTLLPRG